jgi:hypothetical protein
MQAHSNVHGIRIRDIVQSKFISDVGDLTFLANGLLDDCRRCGVVFREVKSGLFESALEDFHEAMYIYMIIY